MTTPTDKTFTSLTARYEAALKAHTLANGKAAATVLDLCQVVYAAKKTLDDTNYGYFLRHSGLEGDAAKNRRKAMLRVGKAHATLKPVADALPASIESLSRLAAITEKERLDRLIADGSVTPLMTMLDAEHVVRAANRAGNKTQKSGTANKAKAYAVTVEFFTSEFEARNAKSLLRSIDAYTKKYGTALGEVPQVRELQKALATFVELVGGQDDSAVHEAKAFAKTIDAFVAKHGSALGIVPELKLSADLELALMEDERRRAVA